MRPTDGGGPANNSWHINDSAPLWSPPHHRNVQDSSLLRTWIDTLVKSVGGVITMSLQVILEQDFHSRVRMGRGR
jgi:hypothetical protein